ncbi:TPA: hypothetical protein ACH3X1_001503 [Trebouxia sp. C0004]
MPRERLPPPDLAWALTYKRHTEEREVEYVRLWTEGQQLLAQLDAVQATHKAVDHLILSAGCYMHPEMRHHISKTHLDLDSLKRKQHFKRCLLINIRPEFLTTTLNRAYADVDQTFASLWQTRLSLQHREMDNLELTLTNQEIVERINFWRLRVLDLEWFAGEADIPIGPDLWAGCRLCDRDVEPIKGAGAIVEVLHAAYKAQYATRYFAAARVPWDGLGGVPYGPVQVSDGEEDGWKLGSTISNGAHAPPTTPPASDTSQEDSHKFFGTSPEPSEEIMADCVKPGTVKPEFQLAESGMVESPEPDAEIAAESAAELPKATSVAPDQAVIVRAQEAPELMMLTSMCTLQAVEVSFQAPLHVPSLDDLHVKEGQRPRTTMAVASSLLMSHLGLIEYDKLKAKHQEARKELKVYQGLNKAAKAQEAATSPLTTTPHVPQSSSSGVCKGRGSNMFSGDGSGDYCGILAAKSQQPHDDLAASEIDPLSSAERPDDQPVQQQQQQADRELPPACEDPWLRARQLGKEDMQPQLDCTPVKQQPKQMGSSRQERKQQVQATEQLLHFNQHHIIQLGGQQALVDGQQVSDERQQVQPQGQSEEGRPSRQTEKSTAQKKHRKKKQQGPSQQQQRDVMRCEGAVESSRVQVELGSGQGKLRALECERVLRWGHDRFEETQNAELGTAKAEFPLAESGTVEPHEAEVEVDSPQCGEESVSETPVTEAVAGVAYESPDAEAQSAAELPEATPAAPDQAVISHIHKAPEAVEVSFQAPLHVPSLDDLHVKEGQRPRTTMAVASSLLMSHLGLKVGDKLRAQHQACQQFLDRISGEVVRLVQEARKELKVYQGLNKAQKAAVSPLTTPSTPHVPQASSSGVCKGRGSNMFISGDYCGILAAKSQQPQPQPHNDLIAAFVVHLPSSAVQPDDQSVEQPQSTQKFVDPIEGAWPSGRQAGNKDMQPQSYSMHVEQQPKHNGSSRLPGEQQVQATEQLLQSNQHYPIQLGGQQAPFNGQQVPDERQQVPDKRQQVQPQGQAEEGRPSRQTGKSTRQKKGRKKKQQGPSQQGGVLQREGAAEYGRVQGGLGRGQGKLRGLKCERVLRWGHDKFEETQAMVSPEAGTAANAVQYAARNRQPIQRRVITVRGHVNLRQMYCTVSCIASSKSSHVSIIC